MIINKYFSSLRSLSCHYVEKFQKKLLFKLKTQVYYTGTFWCVAHAHFCKAEARSAYQLWEARVCIAKAHGVRGFPPSSGTSTNVVECKRRTSKASNSFKTSHNTNVGVSGFSQMCKVIFFNCFFLIFKFIFKMEPLGLVYF